MNNDTMRAALLAIMRAADAAKEPCGADPESLAAIRNGKFASLAGMAAQGLGLVSGPAIAAPAPQPEPGDDRIERLASQWPPYMTRAEAVHFASCVQIRYPSAEAPVWPWPNMQAERLAACYGAKSIPELIAAMEAHIMRGGIQPVSVGVVEGLGV